MGVANSKPERSIALKLCKQRKRFTEQAIDSRYSLAAAHVSYVQSLRKIGIALRRYAEAEVLVEPPLSASATEIDKTPSPSSFPSPSPGVSDSPVLNGSPLSTSKVRVSYMRSGGAPALIVRVSSPPKNVYVEEGEFLMPPPPPPPPESGSSWDYFDPADQMRTCGKFGKEDVHFDANAGIFDGSEMPKLENPMNGHSKTEDGAWGRVSGELKDAMMRGM